MLDTSQPLSLCLFFCRVNVKAVEVILRLVFHASSPLIDPRSEDERSPSTL